MKRIAFIIVILGLLSGGGFMVYQKLRGIRNNNPGNLKRSNDPWVGLDPVQDDPVFFKFLSPVYGIRALLKVLTNYYEKYGLNTVRGIISRYAPASENETENYIQFVSDSLGLEPDTPLNIYSYRVPLAKAITNFENGINPYGDETFIEAEALT